MIIKRSRILQGIREFFLSRGFIEVETPVVLPTPSQEPYLEPLRTTVRDNRGKSYDGFLRMSPEFSLKKIVAAGVERVFEIGPVFRDGEPWGGTHNPEFTMLEWYSRDADYRVLMDDCEALFIHLLDMLAQKQHCGIVKLQNPNAKSITKSKCQIRYQGQIIDYTPPWERLTMRQAWKRYAHLDLDHILSKCSTPGVEQIREARAAMAKTCRVKGYTVNHDDTFDDLFFKIHLSEVEPKLGRSKPTFLTDWPASMAALARKKPRDSRYAERVELYIGGLEIANGFSELVDADEQLARFRADQRLRKKLGKPVYPIDHEFIAALRKMPPTAGIALGVDRLVMLLLDVATIDEVRWLPASTLFKCDNIETLSSKS